MFDFNDLVTFSRISRFASNWLDFQNFETFETNNNIYWLLNKIKTKLAFTKIPMIFKILQDFFNVAAFLCILMIYKQIIGFKWFGTIVLYFEWSKSFSLILKFWYKFKRISKIWHRFHEVYIFRSICLDVKTFVAISFILIISKHLHWF